MLFFPCILILYHATLVNLVIWPLLGFQEHKSVVFVNFTFFLILLTFVSRLMLLIFIHLCSWLHWYACECSSVKLLLTCTCCSLCVALHMCKYSLSQLHTGPHFCAEEINFVMLRKHLFFCIVLFWDRVSRYSLDSSGTCYVDHAGL